MALTYPPTVSGRYMSWLSSTFRVVSLFSEPVGRTERERERDCIVLQLAIYTSRQKLAIAYPLHFRQ